MRSIKQTITTAAALGALAVGLIAAGPAAAATGPESTTVPRNAAAAQTRVDYGERIDELVELVDGYYADQVGRDYVAPDVLEPYDEVPANAFCNGEMQPAENAFFCAEDNTITWDESGLLRPIYKRFGDAAAGFLIAHEWGHAMQDLLGLENNHTLPDELQADCFAGSWYQAMIDQGEFGTVQDARIIRLLRSAGDPAGTAANDPDAHGSARQRVAAARFGIDHGMRGCIVHVRSLPRI